MNFIKRLFHRPTKREVCKAILQSMVNTNPLTIGALRDLDLSAATDEQMDLIYANLTKLRDEYNAAYKGAMKKQKA